MRRVAGWLMILLGVGVGPALGQTGRAAPAAERIKQADKEWLAAVTAKDLERSVSFWADDAVIQPPGQSAVVGRIAISQYVSEAFKQPGFSITWQSTEPIVADGGDMAYTISTNEFTFQDPQGQVVTLRGKGVVIWRRQADGSWKCVVDSWNPEPEVAPATTAK